MKKGIDFNVNIDKSTLAELVSHGIDDAIGRETMEVNSFKVDLTRVGLAEVLPEQKSIFLKLPFKVRLMRENGLFTIEGNGSMNLKLRIDIDVNQRFQATFRTQLEGVDWIETPVLDIGILNIPVERLIQLVLRHYESIITAKIDAKLRQYSDLNALIDDTKHVLDEKVKEFDTKGLVQHLDINHLNLDPLSHTGDKIIIHGLLDLDLAISSNIKNRQEVKKRTFAWMDDTPSSWSQLLGVDILYSDLCRLIMEHVNAEDDHDQKLEIENLRMEKIDDKLWIGADVLAPIVGSVEVIGIPHHDTKAETFHLEGFDLQVKPKNIIYKLVSPLLIGFVKKRITSIFPIALNRNTDKLLAEIRKNFPKDIPNGSVNVKLDNVRLERLDFLDEGMRIEVEAVSPSVDVVLKSA